jgi:pSer/pThr/pTyr-binding forkhead associated (FHA) protein
MTMMGRATLNDVVLEEPGVSRQHAGIRGDAEGYWIADLGSRTELS